MKWNKIVLAETHFLAMQPLGPTEKGVKISLLSFSNSGSPSHRSGIKSSTRVQYSGKWNAAQNQISIWVCGIRCMSKKETVYKIWVVLTPGGTKWPAIVSPFSLMVRGPVPGPGVWSLIASFSTAGIYSNRPTLKMSISSSVLKADRTSSHNFLNGSGFKAR